MQETQLLPRLASYVITSAKSKGGKAPSERELAEHFSVSRGQVREALAILESMQIIERRAKSGIYLNPDQSGIETMAFFARATAWAPFFIALAAGMTALSWGIAWRRNQLGRLTPILTALTAMTVLAWGIWANKAAINDLLISWM